MTAIAFAIGLIAGLIVGIVTTLFIKRTAQSNSEAQVASIADRIAMKNAEQIVQLTERQLTSKKDVIDGTLKHMKDDLQKVETLMRALDQESHGRFSKIDVRLQDAASVIKDLSSTTTSLKTALSSNSGRGQWGERMAEDVLRLSGLVENINYIKQKKLETGSKPDFTFLLPQKLKLNMDVKFPFNNYQLYTEAQTEAEREDYKKKFLKDVKARIKEVQTRDYINPEDSTVDYVLMFVPNEQIFAFINEIDRTLVDEAMQGKTILCSPLSLYAILAVIRQSIDNFSIESKSRDMLTLFGAFRQQWEKFKDQMETVKARFDTVNKGYEELLGARKNQLDKHFTKIEELRVGHGDGSQVDIVFESVMQERIEATKEPKKTKVSL